MRPTLIFCAAALSGALFLAVPEIDLSIAALGYRPNEGFILGQSFPFQALHDSVPALVLLFLSGAILGGLSRRLTQRETLFLILALGLGPGVLANAILKDHWGRARPSHIAEFGGTKSFSPPLLPSNQCHQNCAFVSGDASAGFAFLAPALLTPFAWRRRAIAAALTMGGILGANRILQGGHFVSDVVFAGFSVGGLIWALHWAMIAPTGARFRAFLWRRTRTPCSRFLLYAACVLPLLPIVILSFDRKLALWARALPESFLSGFAALGRLGDAKWWLGGSALLALGGGLRAWRMANSSAAPWWRGWARTALFCCTACVLTVMASAMLKGLIGRTRPRLFFDRGVYQFRPFSDALLDASLPSAHAAMIFSIATALALRLPPRWGWGAYAGATLIALSRVMTTAHWLADSVAGSLVGIGITVLCHRHGVTKGWLSPK